MGVASHYEPYHLTAIAVSFERDSAPLLYSSTRNTVLGIRGLSEVENICCSLAHNSTVETASKARRDGLSRKLSCRRETAPRHASCHSIFCSITQDHSRSFEMKLLRRARASLY